MTAVLDAEVTAAWERALAVWGVRLHDPEVAPDVSGPIAWFSFPPAVTVDLAQLRRRGAIGDLESVLAHEVGHHVVAPRTRLDGLRIRYQLMRALLVSGGDGTPDRPLDMLSNLWTDLIVNHRLAILQRAADPGVEPGIIRAIRHLVGGGSGGSALGWLYGRVYELLWDLLPETLVASDPPASARRPGGARSALFDRDGHRWPVTGAAASERERLADELLFAVTAHPQADAVRLAGLVRASAADPVSGALAFGLVAAPYLLGEVEGGADGGWDGCAAGDMTPSAAEMGRILADPRISAGVEVEGEVEGEGPAADEADGGGQALGIAETLDLWHAADEHAVIAAWYRAEAARWTVPLTAPAVPPPAPDLPGPLEAWEVGDDLADLDWPATLVGGPFVPGVTTRRRSRIDDDPPVAALPVDLEVYIDSSGSMPSPRSGSPAVLAGMILVLSVLRGAGRVRVTSFSGPGQVAGSPTPVRDPVAAATDLAHSYSGGTTFPLDLFAARAAEARHDTGERHLVVLSDDGLVSMFGRGQAPESADVAARARGAFASATLVLQDARRLVADDAAAAGYDVFYLASMADAPAAAAELAGRIRG